MSYSLLGMMVTESIGRLYNIASQWRWFGQGRNVWTVECNAFHYNDVTMGTIASQITSLTIVHSTVYSVADQRKHQSSASLAFVRGIHRGPVNSPHKWPVTRKMLPFDDVIMLWFEVFMQYVYRPIIATFLAHLTRRHIPLSTNSSALCCCWNISGELGQYSLCWWPGSLCRQVNSSRSIGFVDL